MSAKLKQGFMRNVKLSAGTLRLLMNLWPPFIGAGIHVEHLAPDYLEARVRMRLGLLNRNYMGTHFGGSLFAMTDPFFALLVMHRLGRDYVVWDKASRIDYRLPGRGTVRAIFRITPEQVEEIRRATAGGACTGSGRPRDRKLEERDPGALGLAAAKRNGRRAEQGA